MERIPLAVRLKRESHRKIAYAQDLVLEQVYKSFNNAVLHGGTAIWRCFSGKRFSEDLDFYLENSKEKINSVFDNLEKIGFKIVKKKVSDTSVYSELEFDRVRVRLEAIFKKVSGILSDYENSEGNTISIYSLSAEDFIKEKIETYLKRKKVRDLWDIYFLIKELKDISRIKKELTRLVKIYTPPIDEDNLKLIILEGITPTSREMFDYIRTKWEKENT